MDLPVSVNINANNGAYTNVLIYANGFLHSKHQRNK